MGNTQVTNRLYAIATTLAGAAMLALLLLLSPQAQAAAGIFKPMNYQGKLSNTGGVAITNGQYNMKFKIFTAAGGGVPAWTETWDNSTQRVTATGGLFSIQLGTHVTMTGSVNFNSDSLYLQVEFDPGNDGVYEEVFSPRRRFASVPYAHNANTLDGLDSTQFMRTDVSTTASGTITVSPRDASKTGIDILSTAGTTTIAALKVSTQGANHIVFGTGGSSYDTNLYRAAANLLKTDDSFYVVGTLSGSTIKADTLLTSSGQLMVESGAYIDGSTFRVDAGNNRVGIGTTAPKTTLEVLGTASGTDLYAANSISGTYIYAAKTFGGAGLAACNTAATSKLLYNASTKTFSCGTDQNQAWSNTGSLKAAFDARYVNTSGDTMTGMLTIDLASGTLGLKVIQTISGSTVKADQLLASSGTLVVKGTSSFHNALVLNLDADVDRWNVAVTSDDHLDFRWSDNQSFAVTPTLNLDRTAGVGIFTASPETALEVIGTASGRVLHAQDQLQSSGTLIVESGAYLAGATLVVQKGSGRVGVGTASPKAALDVLGTASGTDLYAANSVSGTYLYAARTFGGAGLADCDTAGVSKLLWDATTKRFSCGTDQNSSWSNTGSLQTAFDNRYVKKAGDTMTGALTINVTGGNINTIGLKVLNTISGAVIRAQNTLASSGALIVKKYAGSGTGNIVVIDTNGFVYDATNKRVGIGTVSPDTAMEVIGTLSGSTVIGAIQDRGGQVYNVKAFGAVGDGVTDDRAAILAALNAAATAGRGKVFVPAGTYFLRTQLTWPDASNISLVGAGRGATTLVLSGSSVSASYGVYISTASAVSNATIADMTLRGVANDDTALHDLVRLNGALSDFRFENVEFKWARHSAIESPSAPSGERGMIENCYFHEIDDAPMTPIAGGAIVGSYPKTLIRGNFFRDIGSTGILMHAIYPSASSDDMVIVGNSFTGAHSDIHFYDAGAPGTQNVSVTGNIFSGVDTVYFYDMTSAVVSGNSFYDTHVRIASSGLNFAGNTVTSSTQRTLLDNGSTSNGVQIVGNRFVLTSTTGAGTGIVLRAGQTGNSWTIQGNTFEGTGTWIRVDSGNNHLIENNRITTTSSTATGILLNAGNGHVVKNNHIATGNGAKAVYDAAGGNTIIGNVVTGGTVGPGAAYNATYVTATASGYVGINTSSPRTWLDIATVTGAAVRLTSTRAAVAQGDILGGLEFYSSDTSTGNTGVRARVQAIDNDTGGFGGMTDLRFLTTNGVASNLSEKMRITAGGRVGIGKSSPATALDVVGTLSGSALTIMGRVGVGTASPSYPLHVVGQGYVSAELGVGVAPNSSYVVNLYKSIDAASNAVVRGVSAQIDDNTTSTNSHYIQGAFFEADSRVGAGVTNNGYVRGFNGAAYHRGDGGLAQLVGGYFDAGTYNGGSDTTGTVTDAYAGYFNMVKTAGSTITNGYGIYVNAVEGTNQYGLYVNDAGAKNYFAGNLGLGAASPGSRLSVSGAVIINSNGNLGSTTADAGLALEIIGTASGTNLYATKSVSGAYLYAATTFGGAGLADCDTAGTSKLLWDASTKRFSCGTDQGGSGLSQSTGDERYVNTSGDTMTGALTINLAVGYLGLKVIQTASGNVFHAEKTLASSGSLVVKKYAGTATGNILVIDSQGFVYDASNKRVGIGTASPAALLDVSAVTGAAIRLTSTRAAVAQGDILGGLEFYSSDTSTGNTGVRAKIQAADNDMGGFGGVSDLVFSTANGAVSNLSEKMRITAAGNVGIGTASPGQKLTVSGAMAVGNGSSELVNPIFFIYGGNGTASAGRPGSMQVDATNRNFNIGAWNGLALYGNVASGSAPTTGKLGFWMTSAGKIGLGTSSPGSNLSVSGAVIIGTAVGSAAADAGLALEIIGTASGRVIHAQDQLRSSGALIVESGSYIAGATLVVQKNNGRVGIGTASPKATLDVLGTASGTDLYASRNVSGSNLFANKSVSGTYLYAATTFGGAGLADCDAAATSKLLWDATTKRFSCGTDQGGSALSQSSGDERYVNTSGDTMTGALTINLAAGYLGLKVIQTASGNVFHAEKTLSASGNIVVSANRLIGSGALSVVQRGSFGTGAYISASGGTILALDSLSPPTGVGVPRTMHILFGYKGTFDVALYRNTPETLTLSGHLLPSASNRYDLGSDARRWRHLYLSGSSLHVGTSANEATIGYNTAGNYLDFNSNGAGGSEMVILSAGNVGIGTANPETALEVIGTMSGRILHANTLLRSSGALVVESGAYLAGTTLVIQNGNSRVGINTASPGSRLSVSGAVLINPSGTGSMAADVGLGLEVIGTMSGRSLTVNGSGASILLRTDQARGRVLIGTGNVLGGTDINAGKLEIETLDSENIEALRIKTRETTASQNVVKIITDVTSANNTVFRISSSGAVFADARYGTTGADYAEWFRSLDLDLGPGELTCIDPLHDNSVRRCRQNGDLNVMGIVSTNPAFVGNNLIGADDGNMPPGYSLVGLIGQLPAKAVVENDEPIRPGDSLTPASRPGYARRARAGEPTVGVALQGLPFGEGVINVLVARRNGSLTADAVSDRVLQTVRDMKIEEQLQRSLQATLGRLTTADAFAQPVAAEVQRQVASLNVPALADRLDGLSASLGDLRQKVADGRAGVLAGSGLAVLTLQDRLTALEASVSRIASSFSSGGTVRTEGQPAGAGQTLRATPALIESGGLLINGAIKPGKGFGIGSITFSGSEVSIGSLISSGSLKVVGNVTISGLATFFGDVRVRGELIVSGKQAGYAVIPATGTSVTVRFSTGFTAVPVITVSPRSRVGSEWWVDAESATGFTIRIDNTAPGDVRFAWTALGADNPQTTTGSLAVPVLAALPFPVDESGRPFSQTDPVWTACVEGTVALDSDGNPYNCSRYRVSGHVWHHPDLGIDFTYDPNGDPPVFLVPAGYRLTTVSRGTTAASSSSSAAPASSSSPASGGSSGPSPEMSGPPASDFSSSATAVSASASSASSPGSPAGSAPSDENPAASSASPVDSSSSSAATQIQLGDGEVIDVPAAPSGPQ